MPREDDYQDAIDSTDRAESEWLSPRRDKRQSIELDASFSEKSNGEPNRRIKNDAKKKPDRTIYDAVAEFVLDKERRINGTK